jgi:tetratricopeptide (TPR) repeat protein
LFQIGSVASANTDVSILVETSVRNESKPTNALIYRAKRWESEGRPELALDCLRKLFTLDPIHPEGLTIKARLLVSNGEIDAARLTLDQLRKNHPSYQSIPNLEALLRANSTDSKQIRKARILARSDRVVEALNIWRNTFPDGPPSDDLALEYWQLFARSPNGWGIARRELDKLVRRNPENLTYLLAFVEHETIQLPTNKRALNTIIKLSNNRRLGKQARQAWRSAMMRLDDEISSLSLLNQYLNTEPTDSAVSEKRRLILAKVESERRLFATPSYRAKTEGLSNLEQGNLEAAEPLLIQALESRSDDEEILGGIGMVRLRQGRHLDAQEYFSLAEKNSTYNRGKWNSLIQVAKFWHLMRAARDSKNNKDYDLAESNLNSALLIEANQSDALELLAEVKAEREVTRFNSISSSILNSNREANSDTKEQKIVGSLAKDKNTASIAIDYRYRPGTSGISRYESIEIPLEYRTTRNDNSSAFIRSDLVMLSAGHLATTEKYFGSMALCQPSCISPLLPQNTAGISFNAGYAQDDWQADAGISPLGFAVSNIVGGIEWGTSVGPNRISIELSRRPLTGSLLSFAGSKDPNTGKIWGGVVATGTSLGISIDQGESLGFWASLGAHALTGKNVQFNSRAQLMAGGYWRMINEENRQLSVGLTGMDWAYHRNAGEYTFGHGGYYSPQNYASLSLPIALSNRYKNYSYSLRGALSISQSRTSSSSYYPTDNNMQSLAGLNYAPSTGRGSGYSIKGNWEYQVEHNLIIGTQIGIERSSYYEPSQILIYLIYDFDKSRKRTLKMTPNPVIPSSQF